MEAVKKRALTVSLFAISCLAWAQLHTVTILKQVTTRLFAPLALLNGFRNQGTPWAPKHKQFAGDHDSEILRADSMILLLYKFRNVECDVSSELLRCATSDVLDQKKKSNLNSAKKKCHSRRA